MTDVLKVAIEESGVSRYRIAKDTGITEPSLCRFMQGVASLRLDKADVLAEYLGLELAALWQWPAENPNWFTMTHVYRPLGGPPIPDQMDTLGTSVDLEIFYQYLWQECEKYAEYRRKTPMLIPGLAVRI